MNISSVVLQSFLEDFCHKSDAGFSRFLDIDILVVCHKNNRNVMAFFNLF